MRLVVIHYHMFKNAGTSIDRVLERNLGRGLLRLECSDPARYLSGETILAHVLADPKVRAVSTHTARLPAPEHEGIRFLPVFMLRHPLDRIRSSYDFTRRTPEPADPRRVLQAMMKSMSFKDFVLKALEMKNAFVANFQTTYLSQAHLRVPVHGLARANDDDLTALEAFISDCAFAGVVERFDESTKVLEHAVLSSWPGFRAFSVEDNVTSDRAGSLDGRLSRIAAELGGELYERLVEENAMDIALHAHGNRRLDQLLDGTRAPALRTGAGIREARDLA